MAARWFGVLFISLFFTRAAIAADLPVLEPLGYRAVVTWNLFDPNYWSETHQYEQYLHDLTDVAFLHMPGMLRVPTNQTFPLQHGHSVADFRQAVRQAVQSIQLQPSPELHILFGSHGGPFGIATPGRPSLTYSEILNIALDESKGTLVSIHLQCNSCHSGGMIVEAEQRYASGTLGRSTSAYTTSSIERESATNDFFKLQYALFSVFAKCLPPESPLLRDLTAIRQIATYAHIHLIRDIEPIYWTSLSKPKPSLSMATLRSLGSCLTQILAMSDEQFLISTSAFYSRPMILYILTNSLVWMGSQVGEPEVVTFIAKVLTKQLRGSSHSLGESLAIVKRTYEYYPALRQALVGELVPILEQAMNDAPEWRNISRIELLEILAIGETPKGWASRVHDLFIGFYQAQGYSPNQLTGWIHELVIQKLEQDRTPRGLLFLKTHKLEHHIHGTWNACIRLLNSARKGATLRSNHP